MQELFVDKGVFILKCFKSKKEGREDYIKSIFKALKGNSEKFIVL